MLSHIDPRSVRPKGEALAMTIARKSHKTRNFNFIFCFGAQQQKGGHATSQANDRRNNYSPGPACPEAMFLRSPLRKVLRYGRSRWRKGRGLTSRSLSAGIVDFSRRELSNGLRNRLRRDVSDKAVATPGNGSDIFLTIGSPA